MLLAGRNIFWLFIAVIGFIVGAGLVDIWLVDQPMWLIVAAGIGVGLIGAILAIIFERVAFALAGFYAAAFLAIMFAQRFGLTGAPIVLVFVAGLVGALFVALLTDWAIILLSAAAGAAAIVSIITAAPAIEAVSFAVLATIGVLVQRTILTRRRRYL